MELIALYCAAAAAALGIGVWNAACLAAAARQRLLRRRVAALIRAARREAEGG